MNNLNEAVLSSLATTGLKSQEVEILGAIHTAIVEQRLLPGTRLTEEELAEIYKVSRMRIRRILLALAHTGMIELPAGRGALVARPSAAEAQAVFAARRLIEGRLLETPEQALSAATLKAMQALVARENKAAHAQDQVAMIHLSGAFHIELARAYGNPVIADIVAGLVTRSSLIIALFQNSAASCCRSDEHASLLATLAAKRHDEAGAKMRAHLNAIEAALNLDRPPGGKQDLGRILGKAG